MKHFVRLFNAIDQTTKTNVKVDALAAYFEIASDQDRLLKGDGSHFAFHLRDHGIITPFEG